MPSRLRETWLSASYSVQQEVFDALLYLTCPSISSIFTRSLGVKLTDSLLSLLTACLKPHQVEIPVLIRSSKISKVNPCQCRNGWPFRNNGWCKLGSARGAMVDGLWLLMPEQNSNSNCVRYVPLRSYTLGNGWNRLFSPNYELIIMNFILII